MVINQYLCVIRHHVVLSQNQGKDIPHPVLLILMPRFELSNENRVKGHAKAKSRKEQAAEHCR